MTRSASEDSFRDFGSLHSDVHRDEIDASELTEMQQIGAGSFGIVYRAVYRHSDVAVKAVNENAFGDDTDIVTEVRTLRLVPTHANVVAFRGYTALDGGRPLVLEFCEGGSLLAALRSPSVEWTTAKQLIVARGTAAGLAHLHKCGIVHRDIAARNVLLVSLLNGAKGHRFWHVETGQRHQVDVDVIRCVCLDGARAACELA